MVNLEQGMKSPSSLPKEKAWCAKCTGNVTKNRSDAIFCNSLIYTDRRIWHMFTTYTKSYLCKNKGAEIHGWTKTHMVSASRWGLSSFRKKQERKDEFNDKGAIAINGEAC